MSHTLKEITSMLGMVMLGWMLSRIVALHGIDGAGFVSMMAALALNVTVFLKERLHQWAGLGCSVVLIGMTVVTSLSK